jgi:hypothetical protein
MIARGTRAGCRSAARVPGTGTGYTNLPARPAAWLPAAGRDGRADGIPWARQAPDYVSSWCFTRGAGVTVPVVESGVDANPQFGHRVAVGPDLAGDGAGIAVPAGAECVGHDTAVASLVVASPMPGVTFARGSTSATAPWSGLLPGQPQASPPRYFLIDAAMRYALSAQAVGRSSATSCPPTPQS